MKIFDDLLTELGSRIGLDELAADEDGYCVLVIGGKQVVHLKAEEESENLRFFTELGGVGEDERAAVFEDLLGANVMWRGTRGGTLGWDADKSRATFCYEEPLSQIDFARFEQLLEAFLDTAEKWSARISSGDLEERSEGIDFNEEAVIKI